MRSSGRQSFPITLQPGFGVSMLAIVDIENVKFSAGRHADKRVRPARPPPMHYIEISRRVIEAARCERPLIVGMASAIDAWKDRDTAPGQIKGFIPQASRCFAIATAISTVGVPLR
jgi:hypothetical protein